jgi:acetylornithine deacetylase/succinyl-diaminopimelate desuccinylase-like protein
MIFVDQSRLRETTTAWWTDQILPSLEGLVRIPALSPAFDPAWQASGQLDAAVAHVGEWIDSRAFPGVRSEVVQLPGRSPLLIAEVPATAGAQDRGTVLMYGHLDKQPPGGEWSPGLGPWLPARDGDRLYGRGVVDDGYSGYAAVASLAAVEAAGGQHARTILLLETSEESGSPDLPAYIDHLADRLGEVTLVVCLDAGGGGRDTLWLTSSLRGGLNFTVTVRVLDTPQHSGVAGGIVPSSFRIMRQLLDRLEDPATGEVLIDAMHVPIPDVRRVEAAATAAARPGVMSRMFPLVSGMRAASDDETELILNNSWRPTLSVLGAAGLPEPAVAGNVLRTETTLVLSFRLPPTADPRAAREAVEKILTTDVPYGARVELGGWRMLSGWDAPPAAPWLSEVLGQVGDQVFGKECQTIGSGGGIPFLELLGRRYPQAQFLSTGACASDSNMHAPDEWLDIPFAEKVTEAVGYVLDGHARAR